MSDIQTGEISTGEKILFYSELMLHVGNNTNTLESALNAASGLFTNQFSLNAAEAIHRLRDIAMNVRQQFWTSVLFEQGNIDLCDISGHLLHEMSRGFIRPEFVAAILEGTDQSTTQIELDILPTNNSLDLSLEQQFAYFTDLIDKIGGSSPAVLKSLSTAAISLYTNSFSPESSNVLEAMQEKITTVREQFWTNVLSYEAIKLSDIDKLLLEDLKDGLVNPDFINDLRSNSSNKGLIGFGERVITTHVACTTNNNDNTLGFKT